MTTNLEFDFDYTPADRSALISEAKHTLRGLTSELGGASKASTSASIDAAELLLAQLDSAVVEFGAQPDVYKLNKEFFKEHNLAIPLRFENISKDFKYYWLRFPITFKPANNDMPFIKLKCAVEFNPNVSEGHLRPKTHAIFPDKKFKEYIGLSDSLELKIGEDAELEVAAGIPATQIGLEKASAGGNVGAKAAGQLMLKIGSFEHTWKRAEVDHSPVGTEKVFWLLEGAEYFYGDDPGFIVILKVPRVVDRVDIAAALSAYPKFSLAVATPGEALRYFTEKAANFFRKGVPVQAVKIWDITPNL